MVVCVLCCVLWRNVKRVGDEGAVSPHLVLINGDISRGFCPINTSPSAYFAFHYLALLWLLPNVVTEVPYPHIPRGHSVHESGQAKAPTSVPLFGINRASDMFACLLSGDLWSVF